MGNILSFFCILPPLSRCGSIQVFYRPHTLLATFLQNIVKPPENIGPISSEQNLKHKIMRTIFFFFSICLFFSCQNKAGQSTTTANTALDFPKLLDRPEQLRNGIEWDNVQNFYGTQCAELRKNPNNYEALLKLAECYIQEARVTGAHPHYYPAALEMTERVIGSIEQKTTPSIKEKDYYFQALSHKAGVQLSLHSFLGAKSTAEKAVALNPYNANIYGCLVDANVELGHYDEAVKMCDLMVGIRPDLRSYARVSYLREIHGDYKGAIEAMHMAVTAGYPGYEQTEWARLQLGHLFEKYGDEKMARLQFETALQLRENYPFAMAALAVLDEKQGKNTKAIAQLQQAIKIIPEVGFYTDLAKIEQKTGNKAALDTLIPNIEAMFQEDKAAGHNMALEEARFNLELAGNMDRALELVQTELAIRPDNIDVNKLAAEIYIKKNQPEMAQSYVLKATRTGSKDPELAILTR